MFAEVSISKLLIAGILPGLLTAAVYMIMIIVRCWLNPTLGPPIDVSPTATNCGASAGHRCAISGRCCVLIIGVMGGLYGGVVTPTEGGAAGALLRDADRRPAAAG